MPINITLNVAEQRLANDLAHLRRMAVRRNGYQDRAIGNVDHQAEVDAAGAELAVARYLNVYPDLNLNGFQPDGMLPNGMTFDVKHTNVTPGHMLVPLAHADKPCDLYICVVNPFPRYRILGYVTGGEVFDGTVDLGHGPSYGVHQSRLHDIEVILKAFGAWDMAREVSSWQS